jgi:glycosyltransferase involved in cell wall biosynthesis
LPSPKKICFVSLSSYPTLASKNLGYAGGAEVNQVLLARELLKYGFDISFVADSEGQHDRGSVENIGGIKVIKTYSAADTAQFSLVAKARYVWKAMREANADIYCERAPSGIVALFCYRHRKKFIYGINSDEYAHKGNIRNIISNRFRAELGIRLSCKLASVIVAGNEFQAEAVKQNFGKECVIIPSGYPMSDETPQKVQPPIVLWVASILPYKQPDLFLKLAGAIPQARFQMIGGGHGAPELYKLIKEAANRVANLEFLGFIPAYEIDQYFKQASIFVSTSNLEGFPVTFVQAWAAYLPVVSLNIDPSEVICNNKLGFHSRTFDQMVRDVKLLLEDARLRNEMGQNARRYAEKEHDIRVIATKYIRLLA